MFGFLIAALAGYLTPKIEEPVAGPIVKALEGYFAVAPNEKRLIAFMAALLGAAIIATLMDSGTLFAVVIGAILGYFGERIYAVLSKIIAGRRD